MTNNVHYGRTGYGVFSSEVKKVSRGIDMYRTRAIITRGLYNFYPLFEVHLRTVTFGLMYG